MRAAEIQFLVWRTQDGTKRVYVATNAQKAADAFRSDTEVAPRVRPGEIVKVKARGIPDVWKEYKVYRG